MTVPVELMLRATWGARADSADEIADRLVEMLDAFARAGGSLAEPLWSTATPPVLVTGEPDPARAVVGAGYDTDAITGEVFHATGTSVGLVQHPLATSADRPPSIHLQLNAGNTRPTSTVPANQIVATFRAGSAPESGSTDEVLAVAERLLRDVERIWRPDAASVDSLELLRAQKVRGVPLPKIGVLTWLSDAVLLDPSPLGDAVLDRVDGGVLVGVPLDADDLIERGIALIERVLPLVRPIPGTASRARMSGGHRPRPVDADTRPATMTTSGDEVSAARLGCDECREGVFAAGPPRFVVATTATDLLYRCDVCGTWWAGDGRMAFPVSDEQAHERFPDHVPAPRDA